MVAKPDILRAKETIELELRRFVHDRGEAGVLVYENEWGHLEAIIGSHAFDFHSQVEAQDLLTDWLRKRVPDEYLRHLGSVRLVGPREYDALIGTHVEGSKTDELSEENKDSE